MQSQIPANAAAAFANLNKAFEDAFVAKRPREKRKVSDSLTITYGSNVYSVAFIYTLRAGDVVEIASDLEDPAHIFIFTKDQQGQELCAGCMPIGRDKYGFRSDSIPLGTPSQPKAAATQPRTGHAAPIFARDVQPGEHFIIDSAPFALYVRAYFLDAHPDSFDSVPVVVIAAANGNAHVQVGSVSNLSPIQTVRLVDVMGPLQARAR